MFAWPFSGPKESRALTPQSIDSGYGSMVSSPELGGNESISGRSSTYSDPSGLNSNAKPLKRVAKPVAKEHLDKLKGFKLTFGGPLIAQVRSKPPLKGQHQALHIDMKYIGETAQHARLTIIISCHPAYEKIVNSFLREKRLAIQSFFNPGGFTRSAIGSDGQAEYIHVTVLPLSPTALAKILCQRPDRSLPGLQLVGERLSYQTAEGFQEATFGGFVGISYDVGRWAVFGLTTSHLSDWTLDDEGTYSVISDINYANKVLDSIDPKVIWHLSNSLHKLRSVLKQWMRFEIEPVEGLQSGEYTQSRQRYVVAARQMLSELKVFVKRINAFQRRLEEKGTWEVDMEGSSISSDLEEYADKISSFLKRFGPELGHSRFSSALETPLGSEEVWKSAMRGSFDSVKAQWMDIHDSDLSDDLTGAGDIVAQSTDTPVRENFANLDWALVRIPELDMEMASAIASPGAEKLEIASVERLEVDPSGDGILLNTGQQFPSMGLSGGMSYISIPPSRDFVETFEIPTDTLETPLSKGDSGSWVITEDGQVLGHVVATNAFGDALLIPMEAILQDIKEKLNVTKVSIPKEPVVMAFRDSRLGQNIATQTHVHDESKFCGRKSTESIQQDQVLADNRNREPPAPLGHWRMAVARALSIQEQEWRKNVLERDCLLEYYNGVKARLGQERLAAILDWGWTVQEGYQLKTIENLRAKHKARWSEQLARGAYQDRLWATKNEHWEEDWWNLYIQEWESDIEAWQNVNRRLCAQVEALRRCKELLEFQQRRHPLELETQPPTPWGLTDTRALSTTPSHPSFLTGQPWPRSSRRPLLSLGTSKPPSGHGMKHGSVDSGYGSTGTSSNSSSYNSSSYGATASRPRRRLMHRGGLGGSPLRPHPPMPGSNTGENGNNDDIFPLYEE